MSQATIDAWADATDLVIARLPGLTINFEWPGQVTIQTDETTMLVFGTNADTIGADVNRYRQPIADRHAFWDYDDSPASLVTQTPSSETRPEVIADAILAAFRAWRLEQFEAAGLDGFEASREFDRTYPAFWEWSDDDDDDPGTGCADPDHGIGDHPCDEVLGAERAAALRDTGV